MVLNFTEQVLTKCSMVCLMNPANLVTITLQACSLLSCWSWSCHGRGSLETQRRWSPTIHPRSQLALMGSSRSTALASTMAACHLKLSTKFCGSFHNIRSRCKPEIVALVHKVLYLVTRAVNKNPWSMLTFKVNTLYSNIISWYSVLIDSSLLIYYEISRN